MTETEGDAVTSVGERHGRQPASGQWPAVSGPQRTVAAPARPAPPAPAKPTRARRRPALVALGLALVAVSVLGSVYLATSLGQTRQVVAVQAAVARGETIEASDLALVDLPLGPTILQPIDEGQLPAVPGQVATTDLLPGQLLTEGSFDVTLQVPDDRSIVGVALAPHQLPQTSLRSGDKVRIVETPVSGGEPPVETPRSFEGVVVSSETTDLGDQRVVDIEVDPGEAVEIAARAATGRVALVLDAPSYGGNG